MSFYPFSRHVRICKTNSNYVCRHVLSACSNYVSEICKTNSNYVSEICFTNSNYV